MKKIFCLLISTFPLLINAQTPRSSSSDSLRYYQLELRELTLKTLDSLRNSERYKFLQDRISQLRRSGKGYGGAVFFMDVTHSDFSEFNNSIAQDGFPAIDPISFGFGFGVSNKSEKIIFDLYFGAGNLTSKSKKADTTIRAGLVSLFHIDLGYDVLNSDVVSIYPYAGLSLRISTLEYATPVQVNPGFTNITNMILNDQSVYADSYRLGYQAGIGFDFIVSKDKSRTTHQTYSDGPAIVLFTKIGTKRPIGRDKYKIEDIKYNPGIKQADWVVSLGIKLGSRN